MSLLIIGFLILVIPFFVMPRPIKLGLRDPYEIIMGSVMMCCAATALLFMWVSMSGDGVFSQLQQAVADVANVIADDPTFINMMNLEDTDAEAREKMVIELYDDVLKLMPAAIFIASSLVSYASYALLSISMSRRGEGKRLPPFREFNLSNTAVIALVLVYLVAWLLTVTETVANDAFYVNIDLIFDFIFFLQGSSVLFMLFHKKRIPRVLAFLLLILMWNIYIGRTIMVLIGVFDMIFTFKARMNRSGGR